MAHQPPVNSAPPPDDAVPVDDDAHPVPRIWCYKQSWADETVFIMRSKTQFAACGVPESGDVDTHTEYIYNFAQWRRDIARDKPELECATPNEIPDAVYETLLSTVSEKEGVVMESTVATDNPLSNPLIDEAE